MEGGGPGLGGRHRCEGNEVCRANWPPMLELYGIFCIVVVSYGVKGWVGVIPYQNTVILNGFQL